MADPRDFYRADTTQQFRPDRQVGITPRAQAPGIVAVPGLLPAPTVTDKGLSVLAQLAPELEGIAAQRQRELSEEEIQAGREAALREAKEFGDAVREGKIAPNQSKWFMKGYKLQYGENLGQQWAMEAKVAWESSEAKNSDNPNAARDFLTQFTQEKFKTAAAMDPDVRAGLMPNLGRAHSTIMAAQAEYSAIKVREQHLENVGVAISNDLDLLAAGKMTRADFLKTLESRDKQGILMGINKEDMTKSIVQAVTNKARSSNSMGVLKILDDYRFVGKNPKYASAIRAAEDGIISRSAALESQAWTREQRARQERERVGMTHIFDALYDQHSRGEEPRLTPDIVATMKSVGTPQAFSQTLSMFNTMKDKAQEMDVKEVNRTTMDVIQAGPQALARLDYLVESGQVKNLAVYGQLRSIAQAAVDLTNDRTFVDFTQRVKTYADKAEVGKAMIDPYAGEKVTNEFRYRYIQWVRNNPSADQNDRDIFAQKLSEQMFKAVDQYKLMSPNNQSGIDTDFNALRDVPNDKLEEELMKIRANRQNTNQPKPK